MFNMQQLMLDVLPLLHQYVKFTIQEDYKGFSFSFFFLFSFNVIVCNLKFRITYNTAQNQEDSITGQSFHFFKGHGPHSG